MAGGAGANQVRIFDYETGAVLCIISDMSRAVLCLTNANTNDDFCFGSCDSRLRIMSVKKNN
jgi:WD40 repeat protein